MEKTAVVTGAGTGVGRATALALLREGWRVAFVGRRQEVLQQAAASAGALQEHSLVVPCDIGQRTGVEAMAEKVFAAFGEVELLVNAAGTNLPDRALAKLTPEAYQHLIDTNLNGPFYCVQAFLPRMRSRKSGTIVNIVSEAGKQASEKSGPAYVISKFGLAGLTQSINAEERKNGIRACAIFPGDIDTPLLDLRPEPPSPEARKRMLQSEDVAACVLLAVQLPERAVVEEMIIRPR